MSGRRSDPPTHLLKAGTVFQERYRITAFRGSGGMASVFEGLDLAIDRPVAIKVLHGGQGTPEQHAKRLRRFQREARMAARVRHPNAVTIHDVGVVEAYGLPFIVMELLEGINLDKALGEGGPMNPARALPLLVGCLEALGEGHAQGVVHKDLKPSNLFLVRPGTRRELLKIIDFGIAHLGLSDRRLTQVGKLMGTPQYLAPEYIKDQSVSPALDVYQMGLVMVEMLTASRVVKARDPLACAVAHTSGTLSIPTDLLQSALAPIIERALALDPTRRFPTGLAFAEALAQIDPHHIPMAMLSGRVPRIESVSSSMKSEAVLGTPVDTINLRTPHTIELDEGDMVPVPMQTLDAVPHLPPTEPAEFSPHSADTLSAPRTPPLTETPPERAPLPSAGRSSLVLILAIAAIFAMIAVGLLGVILFLQRPKAPEAPTPPIEAPEQARNQTLPKPEPPPIEQPSVPSEPAAPPVDVVTPQPVPVIDEVVLEEVEITSEPSGVQVYEEGLLVGHTPLVLTFESRSSPPRMLTLKHPRHRPREVEIGVQDGPSRLIALKRVRAGEKKGTRGPKDKDQPFRIFE